MKQPAKLRVCASCEWVFDEGVECPVCFFGSYGAYSVFGKKAYRFALTQEPWKANKLFAFEALLEKKVQENNTRKQQLKDVELMQSHAAKWR